MESHKGNCYIGIETAEKAFNQMNYDSRPSVLGIGLYSQDNLKIIYRDVDQTSKYTMEEITEILEQAQLESVGHSVLEELHDSILHASIRMYDSINVIVVPAGQYEGLVIAHRSGYDSSVSDIAEQMIDLLWGGAKDKTW